MKKLLLSFLIGLTLLFSFAPYLSPVKAQSWYDQSPLEWYLKVYDENTSPSNEIFGERYTAAQVQWVIYSVIFVPIRLIASVEGGEEIITCIIKAGAGEADINSCTEGAFGTLVSTINPVLEVILSESDIESLKNWNPEDVPEVEAETEAVHNDRPLLALVFDTKGRDISGIKYTKNLFNKFSLVSDVKAQGIGYSGITWVQKYWSGFRNISYILIVLVVIVFAFMIMFRVKLNPQTVISVQSALPKVIIALILITFSYAIAGFAIDLMYVISGLFAILIKAAGFSSDSVGAIFGSISGTGAGYNLPIVGGLWVLFEMVAYAIMFIIAAIWSAIVMLVQWLNIFGVILGIVFILIGVWVAILAIWYTFKVPFILIKTLVSLYISIITAPIQILAGALVPSAGFGPWFKKLMADILVFPVVGALFWFAWATLMSAYHLISVDLGHFFDPNLDAAWSPGIIGASVGDGGMSGMIFLAISFGMIVMIPKVPGLLKQFLLGEKFTDGSDIGTLSRIAGGGAGFGETYARNKSANYSTQAGAAGLTPAQQTALRNKAKSWGNTSKAAEYLQAILKNVH